jgi:hypothetical protein
MSAQQYSKRRLSLISLEFHPPKFARPTLTNFSQSLERLTLGKLRMPGRPTLPKIQTTPEHQIDLSKCEQSSNRRRKKVKKPETGKSSTTNKVETKTKTNSTKMLNSFFSNLVVHPLIGQSHSDIIPSDHFGKYKNKNKHRNRNRNENGTRRSSEFVLSYLFSSALPPITKKSKSTESFHLNQVKRN